MDRRMGRGVVAGVVTVLLLATAHVAMAQVATPLFDALIGHDKELDLSPSQIETLARFDVDAAREIVRRQAELALASLDLAALLNDDPTRSVDVGKTEELVRDVERKRAELQLALVRANERVKATLTADQRAKLATLLDETPATAADPSDPSVVQLAARSHGAPSGGGGHPSGGGGHSGGHAPSAPSHHPSYGGHWYGGHSHGWYGGHYYGPRIYVGPGWWWDPFWATAPAPPVIAEAPPVYIEQAPAYWYYCPALRAYYPYVSGCPEPWVPVLANPQ